MPISRNTVSIDKFNVKANGFIRRNRDGAIQALVNWTKTKPEIAAAAYDSTVGFLAGTGRFPKTGCASSSRTSENR